jgi:hypothetical protein
MTVLIPILIKKFCAGSKDIKKPCFLEGRGQFLYSTNLVFLVAFFAVFVSSLLYLLGIFLLRDGHDLFDMGRISRHEVGSCG